MEPVLFILGMLTLFAFGAIITAKNDQIKEKDKIIESLKPKTVKDIEKVDDDLAFLLDVVNNEVGDLKTTYIFDPADNKHLLIFTKASEVYYVAEMPANSAMEDKLYLKYFIRYQIQEGMLLTDRTVKWDTDPYVKEQKERFKDYHKFLPKP